jgi:hypothetical protein
LTSTRAVNIVRAYEGDLMAGLFEVGEGGGGTVACFEAVVAADPETKC